MHVSVHIFLQTDGCVYLLLLCRCECPQIRVIFQQFRASLESEQSITKYNRRRVGVCITSARKVRLELENGDLLHDSLPVNHMLPRQIYTGTEPSSTHATALP